MGSISVAVTLSQDLGVLWAGCTPLPLYLYLLVEALAVNFTSCVEMRSLSRYLLSGTTVFTLSRCTGDGTAECIPGLSLRSTLHLVGDDNIRLSSLPSHPNPPTSPSHFHSHPQRASPDSQLHARSTTPRDVSDRNLSAPPDLNEIDDPDTDNDTDTMSDRSSRPSLLRHADGHSGLPLLEKKDDDRERLGHGSDPLDSRATTPLPAPAVS
ncbi:hypothetical protein CHU98_g11934, partial [Xylaria longipes]